MLRLLGLSILALAPLAAQPFPDAAAVLERSAAALSSYGTVEFTEVATGGVEYTMLHQEAQSGKLRITQKIGGMDGVLIVSDGQNTWMYMAMLKRYMKMPAAGGDIASLTGIQDVTNPALLFMHPKVIRAEVLDVDGQPHDCWVIESKSTTGTLTRWIDKVTSIELKTSTSVGDTAMTTTRHGYRFNPYLDDSLFVFTPPAGASETDELFPGMKTAISGTPAAPPPPITPAAAGDPRAFVPDLTPVVEVQPTAPSGFDRSGAGQVELLLTLDPAGGVVKAEPLTGSDALQKAASDAVTQWKFHPVIRDGAPVFAYTSASVDFHDYSKPAPAGQTAGLPEGMDAMRRTTELETKFPRTPQQELADLEQDLGSGDGPNRAFSLPRLAKAALKAGALEKAAAYAHDLLDLPATDPMFGQAVHDGNMVLGVVAVRRGDLAQAKRNLAESAKTTGSPTLDSFGPNMQLAKALLEQGERDAVLEYFESCKSFWKMGAQTLDSWAATVRSGGIPRFGANLVY